MLKPATFQQHCVKLTNPNITPEARGALVDEVRDSMELVHSQGYASFLRHFLPAFRVVLSDLTSPQQRDNTIHKIRATILEILNRLPHNNVLRERVLDVFHMAMDALKNDNERNAVIAIRIIFDLHKNDRHQLGGQVQPFLDFVHLIYESFGKTAETLLMAKPSPSVPGTPQVAKLTPSTRSFNVITECPLLVMFVFQLYPSVIQSNIQKLLPLMIRAMQYTVLQMIPANSKKIFQEFIASQVKTVSFLAYLLRQFPEFMKADEQSIPRSVVKLMQTCPGDSVAIRKELLVATRHILTSRFRRGFFTQVDVLLNERILIGTGPEGTALRPLAYSFLAELVHCVRLNLSIPQLQKIIFLFSTNVHDPTFSYTLQTNSVRLLLNLIEGILKVGPADGSQRPAARELLIRILETLVAKYVTLGEQVPRLLDSVVAMRSEPDPVSSGKRLSDIPVGDPLKEIADFKTLLKTLTLGLKTVIWSAINIRIPQSNMSKSTTPSNLEAGGQQRKTATSSRQSIRTGLLEQECEIVSRLLPAGRKCFRLYSRHEKANGTINDDEGSQSPDGSQKTRIASEKSNPSHKSRQDVLLEYSQAADPSRIVAATPQEEREVLEQFAQIFTVLDPPSFQDVFGLRIGDLFDYIVENGAALAITQHFLSNSSVSKYFADILFNFAIENMGYLDVPSQDAGQKLSDERKKANSLFKLFKNLFASVNLFANNEPVLRLHLQSMVKTCLKHIARAKDPHAYLQMLRALCKVITNGKHDLQSEVLYRDFMPLVEPMFSHLLALYAGPSRLAHREEIIELCLMVPARPSTIFPYLEQQIKPIVWALEGGRENPMYGLRTLEFWVDMLQPGYLRLLLSKVEPDLSRALYRHLRPPGNAFGPGALRILGKLGARSRNQKSQTSPFKLGERDAYTQTVEVEWKDGLRLNIETDELIDLASETLLDRRDKEVEKYPTSYKAEAWKLLFGCLCPFLEFRDSVGSMDIDTTENRSLAGVCFESGGETMDVQTPADLSKLRQRLMCTETTASHVVSIILKTLLASAMIPELKDTDVHIPFLEEAKRTPGKAIETICKFFALLLVQECKIGDQSTSDELLSLSNTVDEQTSVRRTQFSPNVFTDAMIAALSLESRQHAKSTLECLGIYLREVIGFCTKTTPTAPAANAKPDAPSQTADVPEVCSALEQKSEKATTNQPALPSAEGAKSGKQDIDGGPQGKSAMDIDVSDKREASERMKLESVAKMKEGASLNRTAVVQSLGPLIDRLCHCCYKRTWNGRWAGVHGLNAVMSYLSPDSLTFPMYHASLARCFDALLFLARDTSDFGDDGTVSLASKVLENVILDLFHPLKSATASGTQKTSFQGFADQIYKRLASDLTSEAPNARKVAKACFTAIAKTIGQDESNVLAVVRSHILKPLHERPIRQHAIQIQIGYLDALNFCLRLEKPVLSDHIFASPWKEYVLVESMHIMDAGNLDPAQDADDGFRAKYHEYTYIDGKKSRQLVHLRRTVLEFLCNVSIQCFNALQESQHERIFRSMISCFFMSLQSRDEEMVRSAKRGLKNAISQHPKPKEVLQHNLRPLLGNLGDYKKLTLQYLQGFNRVLELFSHWFHVNLGEKLLEHLQRWTEPEKILPLKKMMAGSESKVAAAILDLFHLLPAAASKFMEPIVNMVLKLEPVIALAAPGAAHLGLRNEMGASTSPYRTPLLKYSNQHAAVASKFFLERLNDDRIRQLFFVMIRSTESIALRKDLMQMPKRLLGLSHFSLDDNTGKSLHVITLIDLLSRHEPAWLKVDAEVMQKLSSYWKIVLNASELNQNNPQTLPRVRAVKMLAEIFIRYCKQFPEEIDLLFELLPVFSSRTICDFTFIKDFLYMTVTRTSLLPDRKEILSRFLGMFRDSSQSQEKKVQALQYIITPMVKNLLDPAMKVGESLSTTEERTEGQGSGPSAQLRQKPTMVLDASLIQRITKELLDQPDAVFLKYDQPLSSELLRFATLLIQFMPVELGRHKQELIKFGWNHLKREDSIAKYWAFVNVSQFFSVYQAPVKIILQVYVALLRACQGDGKELINQALDVLTPALPIRLVHKASDHKYPIWIRYTKKILLEEGHSLPHLVHIWQLIVRHPSLFYSARAQFVPIMVNSLSRIGLNAAPPTENRRLASDLVQLILDWEKTRRKSSDEKETPTPNLGPRKRLRDEESEHSEEPTREVSQESDRNSGAEPPTKTRKNHDSKAITVSFPDDFKPSPTMVDMIVNFLAQVLFRPMDRREAPVLARRCISLLEDAISLWPEATVRLHFIEKLLAPLPAERNHVNAGAISTTKGVTGALGADFGSAETKNSGKAEGPQNDKIEQVRVKRIAARHSALMTSLLLFRVLTKHLGRRFVQLNISPIRALIEPSFSEGSLEAAAQFASVLEEILRACPIIANSTVEDSHHMSSDFVDKKDSSVQGGAIQGESKEGEEKQATPSAVEATKNSPSGNAWLQKLVAEVEMVVESCLKSSDTKRNHCGMTVLRTFCNGTLRDFRRYQESLAKILHRMTKENLSAAQASSSTGGSNGLQGAGQQRSMVSTERASSLNANPNTRGSSGSNNNPNQEKGQGNDNIRGAKSSSNQKNGQQNSMGRRTLLLSLSLLGKNISTLEPGQRKTLFSLLWLLIDRCVQVEVLLEIVRIVESWVFWKPKGGQTTISQVKEPLSAKDKVSILLKMIIFERISGHRSRELMNAYLMLILRIFGGAGPQDKRPELVPKLERAFMLGLKTTESPLREKFFQIYNGSVDLSLPLRLNYVVAKQDWEHLSDTFWIKHATELILAAVNKKAELRLVEETSKFVIRTTPNNTSNGAIGKDLPRLKNYIDHLSLSAIIEPLLRLSHFDSDFADKLWLMLVPKTWEKLSSADRTSMEKSAMLLLTKEYHQMQVSWRRNNVRSLLESFARCQPLPMLRPDVVRHLGSKWNAWYSALSYLERKEAGLSKKLGTGGRGIIDDRERNQIHADLEDVLNSQTSLFKALHERDFVASLWKQRGKSKRTTEALCLEQIGLYTHAQETYSEALSKQMMRPGSSYGAHQTGDPGGTEIVLWEERWVECARNLCQWEVLTEFSRTIVNSKLLHECLWRLPDWSALKELLIKNPVADGPQLKIYQAYVQLQENKLEVAENFIKQGCLKAQEKFCSLPETSDLDATTPILIQFQQLVELQESTRILSELNALSRHGSGGVNVDQKVDNIRLILNTWRERLPSIHESLSCWNDILTWRNHVHAVVVNVLDALKEAANAKVAATQSQGSAGGGSRNAGGNSQAAQVQAAAAIAQALSQQVLVMGVNETAWNVHRFAKACRKQGHPDVALYVLQKMYPFGTMELTEYFVKTKETARSFMAGPRGLEKHVEYGLHELNRCNMDHFNSRQKAQLFTVKGKLCMALGNEDDAVDAFNTALHTSPDVGSAWLAWGQHCDAMQARATESPSSFSNFIEQSVTDKQETPQGSPRSGSLAAKLSFREAAVNCYIQAARFGSRKTRSHFPRILRLLSTDLKDRIAEDTSKHVDNSAPGHEIQAPGTANKQGGVDQASASNSKSKKSVTDSDTTFAARPALQHASKFGVSKVVSDTTQELPPWMWLPWIPQLVTMLMGQEAEVIRPILVRLAQQYPQALFYPLKSLLEDRKLIDKPSTALYREAMKRSRPITAALKLSASPPQLSAAVRHTQVAKENAQRATQRYQALRKQVESMDKEVAASEGTPEHAANFAKRTQLKNELTATHRALEKYYHALQAATQRQKQIQEIITGIKASQGTGREARVNPGKPQSTKQVVNQDMKIRGEVREKETAQSDVGSKSTSQGSDAKDATKRSTTPFEMADVVMTELVKNHQVLHKEMDMIATEMSLRLKPTPEESVSAITQNLLHQCYNLPLDGNPDVVKALRKTLEEVGLKFFGAGANLQRRSDELLSFRASKLRQVFQAELAPQASKDFPTDVEGIILRLRRWQRILERHRNSIALHYLVEDVSKYLANLNETGVEVFGQYFEDEFSEPSVEKHIKIARFCSEIGVCRGASGTCREFYVVGSDGKRYHFIAETGTKTSVQTAEERMSQLYRLLNGWVFGKNCETQRRRIQLTVPAAIGVGNKVRIISQEEDTSSLEHAANRYLKTKGRSCQEVVGEYRKSLVEGRREQKEDEKKGMIEVKRKALNEICEAIVPEWCLSEVIRGRITNETRNFTFRKRLAASVGFGSLVSYLIGIEARGANKAMICWRHGTEFDGHVRLLTKNMKLGASHEGVPFRLTRNMEKGMGRLGVSGPLFGCMACSLQAMRESDKLLEMWVDLLGREELRDLVKIQIEGAMKKAGSSVKIGEREKEAVVDKMLEDLMKQLIRGVRQRLFGQTKEGVIEMTERLIGEARDVDKQLAMDISWQAWL